MTERVLVTGATGGLGLSLVAALTAQGREVVATGRREFTDPRLCTSNIRQVRADLTGASANLNQLTADVSTIFHCAALSSPWGRRKDFHRANVEATNKLLVAAVRNGVRRFVHVSSPSIYADMRDRLKITEDDLPANPPLNHYAATKLLSEKLVLAADGRMQTVAIRPRGIVGPDDTVVLPRLAAIASRKTIPLIRSGLASVEMIDVRDVVSALLAAETHIDAAHGKAINVSGGQPISVRNAALGLARALGNEPEFKHVPLGIAKALASAADAFYPESGRWGEPKLTRYSLATLAYSQTFDLTRSRKLLKWLPEHNAFQTLIREARRTA